MPLGNSRREQQFSDPRRFAFFRRVVQTLLQQAYCDLLEHEPMPLK